MVDALCSGRSVRKDVLVRIQSRALFYNLVQRPAIFGCQQINPIMRLALICLTIVAGLISCKKEKLDINSFWFCHQSLNLDSAQVTSRLAGSWIWAKQSCFWTGVTISADKNVKLTFKTDQTFSVTEESNMLTQGTWKLKQVDGSSWGLDISSPSEYLFGRILFCGNQVLFNDSYIDGCDNLFKKNN